MPPVYSESEASPKGRAVTGGSQTQLFDAKENEKGYEVAVKSGDNIRVYCVDDSGKIRGDYIDGFKHYMSDFELWSNHAGFGKMTGEFKQSGKVSIADLEGKVISEDLPVVRVYEVSIAEMTRDPVIVGFGRLKR